MTETIDLVRREIRVLLDAYEAAASQQDFNLAELRHISGQCAGSLLLLAGVQHVPPWLVPRTELETALRDLASQREYVRREFEHADALSAKVAEMMLARSELLERVTLRRDQFEGGDDARRLAWSELDKVRQLIETLEA
jgi:hypothetical protein